MPPRVTVLQLDTDFPRIAGDVGCARSYSVAPQIIRVHRASVKNIVTSRPQDIDIAPFEEALRGATGDLIVTSCGFLSYWQDHLAALTNRPFISSALTALDRLSHDYRPDEIAILTFDAASLNAAHLGRHRAYASSITGLPEVHHLRHVIGQNLPKLDRRTAMTETASFMTQSQTAAHRHILLECTNLPPYREAIETATGLPVTDILTQIEAACPGSVAQRFKQVQIS